MIAEFGVNQLIANFAGERPCVCDGTKRHAYENIKLFQLGECNKLIFDLIRRGQCSMRSHFAFPRLKR